jgi:hypothetical protein
MMGGPKSDVEEVQHDVCSTRRGKILHKPLCLQGVTVPTAYCPNYVLLYDAKVHGIYIPGNIREEAGKTVGRTAEALKTLLLCTVVIINLSYFHYVAESTQIINGS